MVGLPAQPKCCQEDHPAQDLDIVNIPACFREALRDQHRERAEHGAMPRKADQADEIREAGLVAKDWVVVGRRTVESTRGRMNARKLSHGGQTVSANPQERGMTKRSEVTSSRKR